MSRPGFIEGALAAGLLALGGAVAVTVLSPWLGGAQALRLALTCVAAAYLAYLLSRSRERTGRIVVPCLWLAATAIGWATLGLTAFVLLQTAMLWLVRALYHHGGALAALLDLALCAFALAAGAWAVGTGSWLLTLWCFFLVQALFTWIPDPRAAADAADTGIDDHGFEEARELARSALERLAESGR